MNIRALFGSAQRRVSPYSTRSQTRFSVLSVCLIPGWILSCPIPDQPPAPQKYWGNFRHLDDCGQNISAWVATVHDMSLLCLNFQHWSCPHSSTDRSHKMRHPFHPKRSSYCRCLLSWKMFLLCLGLGGSIWSSRSHQQFSHHLGRIFVTRSIHFAKNLPLKSMTEFQHFDYQMMSPVPTHYDSLWFQITHQHFSYHLWRWILYFATDAADRQKHQEIQNCGCCSSLNSVFSSSILRCVLRCSGYWCYTRLFKKYLKLFLY